MKRNKFKRNIAFLLSFAMIFASFGSSFAFAGETNVNDNVPSTTAENAPKTQIPEGVQQNFDAVKNNIFKLINAGKDGIKNDSPDKIKTNLWFKGKLPARFRVIGSNKASWAREGVPYMVEVTFDKSSRPDILQVPSPEDSTAKGIMLVKKPEHDTEVIISMTLIDKDDPSIKEKYDLKLNVLGTKDNKMNVLDNITRDFLFDAIKGENTSMDNITKQFILPANGGHPLYAKVHEDGSFDKWWGAKHGSQIEIEITKSDDPEIIQIGNEITINFPEKDTWVNLEFEVRDLADTKNKKTIFMPLLIKGESKYLKGITPELLFDAIKGENENTGEISKPLVLPEQANNFNPFYAKMNDDGSFNRWWGSDRQAQIKVEVKDTDHPELIKVGEDELVIKEFPDARTDVKLNFVVSEVANPSFTKDVSLTLTLKSKKEIEALQNTKKELQGYLDKYLTPKYITYSQMKKPGVSFGDDYAKDNVRYTFNLPNIVNLENLPWKEVKATVTADKKQDMNVKYKYTCEPVRADVGGKTKTVVLTYTLEKNGCKVSKDFTVKIPALTDAEIDEELALLKDAKAHLFEGMKGDNFDADNVTKSLKDTLYEVRYDEKGNLVWADNAKETLYCGLHFPSNEGWDVEYVSGDKGFFDSVNMVLKNRPSEDSKVIATHSIESMQLQRYAELYKDNEKLQKLKKQNVSIEFTVRKVNSDLEKLIIAGQEIKLNGTKANDDVKTCSLLTDKTQNSVDVKVLPVNKGANVLIAGTDVSGKFETKVNLENGFKRFAVAISDEDSKNAGTKKINNIQVTVASREYLEREIAKLPDDPKDATRAEVEVASKLWNQYHGLSDEDKNSIKDHIKLEKYKNLIDDPLTASRNDVNKVASKLFDGIKGNNLTADNVYTDLEEVTYAKISGDKIVWSKDAKDSDVRIQWISSSSPEYINIHDGNDFESGYVKAFKISKRPHDKALPVVFKAKLTHLKDTQINKDVDVEFTLREYNASLKSLTIDEIKDFALEADKTEYTIEKPENIKNVTLNLLAEIPNATITVNGQKVKDGKCIVDVSGDETTVKIVVNDGTKNTLNDKWAEKEYTLVFKTKAGEVGPEKPEPGKPDPGKPDPGKPNPGKPDPGKPNPGKPDPQKPTIPESGDSNNAGNGASSQQNQTSGSESPKTADANDMQAPLALIALASLGIMTLYRRKER